MENGDLDAIDEDIRAILDDKVYHHFRGGGPPHFRDLRQRLPGRRYDKRII